MISLGIAAGLIVAGALAIAALPWTEEDRVATTTAARRVGAALRRLAGRLLHVPYQAGAGTPG